MLESFFAWLRGLFRSRETELLVGTKKMAPVSGVAREPVLRAFTDTHERHPLPRVASPISQGVKPREYERCERVRRDSRQ